MKIRAGVLIYAMVISILTLIFLLCLLQYFLYSNQHKLQLINNERNEDILQSGIEFLLAKDIKSSDTLFSMYLFEDDSRPVLLSHTSFGIFDILTSSFVVNKDTLRKTAIVGTCQKPTSTALLLEPCPYSLKIGGNALLEGDIFISQKGIDRAYIGGKSYARDSLVYGNVNISGQSLPEINQRYSSININNCTNLYKKEYIQLTTDHFIRQIRTFYAPTLIFHSTNEVVLTNDTIIGNCIVQSAKSITIKKSAFTDNCIISAPKVIIEDHFKGNLQIISCDTIVIGTGVKLSYPSAIYLNQLPNSEINPVIEIKDSAQIEGLVIAIQNKKVLQKQFVLPVISINDGAEITGYIYCTGAVFHKGLIIGSLFCKQLTDLSSGVNESLLIDGKISKRQMLKILPEFNISDKGKQKSVLKWVK